jgi:hypothetical protein
MGANAPIMELYRLDVPLTKIVDTHLRYGKYLSLKKYIEVKIENNVFVYCKYSSSSSSSSLFMHLSVYSIMFSAHSHTFKVG